ncbi:MAG: hypothetical protein HY814_07685 [Candidatus Riflebacteria bacterium]|nr:hypothetical protein [Candidatus Riflebacteria bacterium]
MASTRRLSPALVTLLAGVLLLACLPEVAGFVLHGDRFLGVPNSHDLLDNLSYVERARSAREGRFAFPNLHTAEDQDNPQLNVLPWLLGWLMGLLGSSPMLYCILTKVVFAALALAALAWLATRVLRAEERTVGLFYLVLSGGFFWTLDVPSLWRGPSQLSYLERLAIVQPESANFFLLYFHGHMALALALLLGCLYASFLARPARPRLAFGTAMALALFHPYDSLTLATVSGAYLAWLFWAERDRFGPCLRAALAAGAGTLGPAVVHFTVSYTRFASFERDDYWLRAPDLLFGYGQPLVLALYFAAMAAPKLRDAESRRRFGDDTPLWCAWLLVAPLLIANPWFYFRRKLALGLSVPVAILAARGTLLLAARVLPDKPEPPPPMPSPGGGGRRGGQPRGRRVVVAVLTAMACFTPVDVVVRDLVTIAQGRFPTVLSPDLRKVCDWLEAESPPGRVVLALPDSVSQLLPGVAGRRVFKGWSIFVQDLPGKRARQTHFLAPETGLAWRESFLFENGIDRVVLDDEHSRLLGADRWPFLEQAARFGAFTIFRLMPKGASRQEPGSAARTDPHE